MHLDGVERLGLDRPFDGLHHVAQAIDVGIRPDGFQVLHLPASSSSPGPRTGPRLFVVTLLNGMGIGSSPGACISVSSSRVPPAAGLVLADHQAVIIPVSRSSTAISGFSRHSPLLVNSGTSMASSMATMFWGGDSCIYSSSSATPWARMIIAVLLSLNWMGWRSSLACHAFRKVS